MTTQYERHIRLEGAHNVRDLGGYATAGGATTRWRSLLRADALHELTAADIDTLLETGVRTVIDLRSDVEIAREPSALAGRDDIRYVHIPLFDALAPVDAAMTATGRFELAARYVDAIENCRPAILKVAAAIADADDGVILFNCTAGKDRTGIIAAMLLALAGVDVEDIATDYALTQELAADFLGRLKLRAIERGLDEGSATRLLGSERATMLALLGHLGERHGSFRDYLAGQGDTPRLALIEKRLISAEPTLFS